eukprot:Amastigsp_a340001_217.p3 type:complete len:178 gc:universal Amastigsp_a340001_217:95-628(+)
MHPTTMIVAPTAGCETALVYGVMCEPGPQRRWQALAEIRCSSVGITNSRKNPMSPVKLRIVLRRPEYIDAAIGGTAASNLKRIVRARGENRALSAASTEAGIELARLPARVTQTRGYTESMLSSGNSMTKSLTMTAHQIVSPGPHPPARPVKSFQLRVDRGMVAEPNASEQRYPTST